jgi:sugar lactone lactonase YvrE
MLGGDDGKTLFMMTAPSSVAEIVAASRQGQIMTKPVTTPRAGRP